MKMKIFILFLALLFVASTAHANEGNSKHEELEMIYSQPGKGVKTHGTWQNRELCKEGFAYSFRVWWEPFQGAGPIIRNDDTAVNAIELACETATKVRPTETTKREIISSGKGSWTKESSKWYDCPTGQYLYAYRTVIEPYQGTYLHGNILDSIDELDVLTAGKEKIMKIPKEKIGLIKSLFNSADDTSLNSVIFECRDPFKPNVAGIEKAHPPLFTSVVSKRKSCDTGYFVTGLQTNVESKQGKTGDDTALNDVRLFCKKWEKPEKQTD